MERKTYSQLKAAARDALPGRLGSAFSAVLLYLFLILCLSGLPVSQAPDHAVLGPVFVILLTIAVSILGQMAAIGVRFRFMKLLFGQPPMPGDTGIAFRGDTDRAVLLCGPRALLYSLCLLPASLLSLTVPTDASLRDLLPVLVVLAAGRLTMFLLRLDLTMADYLYLDYPSLSAPDLLRMSHRLISGSRLRLLFFYLSYLPLHLLALLSLGLTEPLVLCYVYAGEAAFYTDLIRTKTGLSR